MGMRSNPAGLVSQTRDEVMIRLGLSLSRMKQNFIVARLLSDDFIKAVEKGEDVSSWVEGNKTNRPKHSIQKGKNPDVLRFSGFVDQHLNDGKAKSKKEKSREESAWTTCKVSPDCLVIGNTEDNDPLMEHECLDTRLQFLNYCQKNNFQFDELRRAKHSSMMLLFHLHKPQIEREQQIKVHLDVISHAVSCGGPPNCMSTNCKRMKQLFDHVKECDLTFKRGCKICARLFMLLTTHARDCISDGACAIPFCDRVRERNKRLLKQQQLMDDRRRTAQNDRHRQDDDEEHH